MINQLYINSEIQLKFSTLAENLNDVVLDDYLLKRIIHN